MSRSEVFAARARTAASEVHRVPGIREAAGIAIRLVPTHEAVVVAPSLAEAFPDMLPLLGLPAPAGEVSPASFLDPTLGLSAAELGVAETGSVLMVEDHLAERLVSMLSTTLVQIVKAGRIVDSLDEAADWMTAHRPRYAALVTGPSRTADIERTLTIGVQGPRKSHVVVIGE